MKPCKVDCLLAAWSGWSKCSAECGSGVRQRVREVKRAMKHGGKPCGATSESESCNIQGCEKDCELTQWTKWSWCSKDCDGGTRKRMKFVKAAAEGAGKCPGAWDKERLQTKACNTKRCEVEIGEEVMHCNATLDVVFLIDGSGSLGPNGWKAELVMAKKLVEAFSDKGAQAQMSVILFSGPPTWSGVYKCVGKNAETVDIDKVCRIKTVTHFSSDMKEVGNKIQALKWPKGSTLTSLALQTAKAELTLGRKDAKSVIIVLTDGRPLSYRNTWLASQNVRKSARLLWVPVTKNVPLKEVKLWATRRWQENVVAVDKFDDLEKPDAVNHIIADICPKQEFGWGGMWKYNKSPEEST